MKGKKKILLCSILALAAVTAGTVIAVNGNVIGSSLAEDAATWHHYTMVDATQSTKGTREYWVKCGGGYQFTAPGAGSGTIVDMKTAPDTSLFAATDDRYIYPVTLDAQIVDMKAATKALNIGEYTLSSNLKADGTFDLGNDASDIDVSDFNPDHSDDGEKVVTAHATKDSKVHKLFIPTIFATKLIANSSDFCSLIPNATNATATVYNTRQSKEGTGVVGYFVQTADFTVSADNCGSSNFDWNRFFVGTYNGNGHTITTSSINSASAGSNGLLINVENSTIKNLTIADTTYAGWHQACIFAKAVYNTTFENVKFRIDSLRSSMNYQDDKDSGWISWGLFMNNKMNNCLIDARGLQMSTVICYTTNVNACAFTNTRFMGKSYTKFLYSGYSSKELVDGSTSGISLESPETIVEWTAEHVTAIHEECVSRWDSSKTTETSTKYPASAFQLKASTDENRRNAQRGAVRFSTYEYLHVILPKVSYNSYDYVAFRVATTHGTRCLRVANSASDIYYQKVLPNYGTGDRSVGTYCWVDIVIKGGKIYQNDVEVGQVYDANILNGTVGFSFQLKAGANGEQSGYNNTVSDLWCFKAA